jgi:site-specific DNA recombinase
MKAVVYARVSSTDERQSYDRQVDELKRFSEYKNLKVVKTFAEKISGFKKGLDEREAFNEMKIYVEKENIKHILVSELSRISRRYIDTINFINDCSKKGINIHIKKEGLSTLNDDGTENSMVQMLTGMLSSIAEQEAKTLSYRIKSGKEFAARSGGDFNKKIYGYDSLDGRPVINEEQAILVKKMFEMYILGIGSRSISNYLNENYETKKWTGASVHSIVRNSFFCGQRKYKGLVIDVPAIVSEEDFNKVQEFINSRKRFTKKSKHPNPFASFIKCECGATMTQVVLPSNNLNLYKCSVKCGLKSINREFLIDEVRITAEKNAKLSKEADTRERLGKNIKSNEADIIVHERKIMKLNKQIDRNYEMYLNEEVDKKEYHKYKGKFGDEITKLTTSIKELKESIRGLKNTLQNDIINYSKDLSVFKSQLLNVLEWIEVRDAFAVVKLKGWGKQVIVIYRGSELLKYRNLKFIKNRQ